MCGVPLSTMITDCKVSKRGTLASRPDPSQVSSQKQQQQADQQLPDEPSRQQGSEEVPEVVNDRMLKRIIAFSGIPVFVGFSLFPFFYFLKVACFCVAYARYCLLPVALQLLFMLLTSNLRFSPATQCLLACHATAGSANVLPFCR